MSGEVDLFGVFVPVALVTAAIAFIAAIVLRRVLRELSAYAFIWHAGLFDVAMFIVLWWFIATTAGTPTT